LTAEQRLLLLDTLHITRQPDKRHVVSATGCHHAIYVARPCRVTAPDNHPTTRHRPGVFVGCVGSCRVVLPDTGINPKFRCGFSLRRRRGPVSGCRVRWVVVTFIPCDFSPHQTKRRLPISLQASTPACNPPIGHLVPDEEFHPPTFLQVLDLAHSQPISPQESGSVCHPPTSLRGSTQGGHHTTFHQGQDMLHSLRFIRSFWPSRLV